MRNSHLQTQLWGQSRLCHQFLILGLYGTYTSHPYPFVSLFIRLYHICLALFFTGIMKYLPVGKKYRRCNVKNCTCLSLVTGLDEGVCIFVQALALDNFCLFQIHFFPNLQLVVVGKPLSHFSLDYMLGIEITFYNSLSGCRQVGYDAQPGFFSLFMASKCILLAWQKEDSWRTLKDLMERTLLLLANCKITLFSREATLPATLRKPL